MLQHARRALLGPCQQQALAQQLGGCASGSRFSSTDGPSLPHHLGHAPSSNDREQQQQQQQPRLPACLSHSLPLLRGLATSSSSSSASSCSSPPITTPTAGFAASPLLLGMRRAGALGLGRAGALRLMQPSSIASPCRPYGTEGQHLGTAFLLATDLMFWSGLIGAVVFRRNLIVMLLTTEIVMLACNLNFLFGAAYMNDIAGIVMSITITTVAACETAIGLALCVTYFHLRSATDVEALNFLK